MEKKMNKIKKLERKQEKGITLVALVITIVIIIILATATITLTQLIASTTLRATVFLASHSGYSCTSSKNCERLHDASNFHNQI